MGDKKLAAFGTYSVFTGTTTNSGNSFAAGTVSIQDDSGLSSTAAYDRAQNAMSGTAVNETGTNDPNF